MRKLIVIIICLAIGQIIHAQEKYYIIPEAQAKEWKQYRITWYWGIDPVQIKSGEWIVSEDCYKLLKTDFIDDAKQVSSVKVKADSVRIELVKYELRAVDKIVFKETEEPKLEEIKK